MESAKEKESRNSSSSLAERLLLTKYYKRLGDLGIQTIERGTRLQHAKWMCLKAQSFECEGKMNRWLGWIQCSLERDGIYGLSEIIEHTREEMSKYDRKK